MPGTLAYTSDQRGQATTIRTHYLDRPVGLEYILEADVDDEDGDTRQRDAHDPFLPPRVQVLCPQDDQQTHAHAQDGRSVAGIHVWVLDGETIGKGVYGASEHDGDGHWVDGVQLPGRGYEDAVEGGERGKGHDVG